MVDTFLPVDLQAPENELFNKCKTPYVEFIYSKKFEFLMSKYYLDYAERINDFRVRTDDVWLITYPKSGTTWAQEMVWCIQNNLDFKTAREISIIKRSPNIESQILYPPELLKNLNDMRTCSIEYSDKLESPRVLKSHLPWHLLPKQIQDFSVKPKIIYVVRNPKDVMASYYNYYSFVAKFQSTVDDFCELFLTSKVFYGSQFKHVESFLNHRDQSHILFIKYEDMKNDLTGVIKQTAAFLNKPLTNAQVDALKVHLSFDNMKNNEALNLNRAKPLLHALGEISDDNMKRKFFNKGQIGGYKGLISDKYLNLVDEKIQIFENENNFKFGE